MKKKYYLATTGISKIWDLDKKLLLLGPWCATGEKNKKLLSKYHDYLLVPSPWKPVLKIKEASHYCHNVYEKLLIELVEKLNSIHQVSYPVRYWKVLIGPWLLYFIGVFFERFKRIENTIELYPDFYTYALPLERCNVVSFDTYEFSGFKINDDFYNFTLFSFIIHELCPEQIKETDYNIEIQESKTVFDISLKHKLFNMFLMICNHFFSTPLILADMYHLSPSDILFLKFKTGFKTLSFMDDSKSLGDNFPADNYSYEFREKLHLGNSSTDKFQSLLFSIIPRAIPLCYIENYNFYRKIVRINKFPRIIGSSVGWYFNERFKFFAAESASKGTRLIEFQHGGGYGMTLSIPQEFLLLDKDIFYSWGWNINKSKKIKSIPNPCLSKLRNKNRPLLDKILFISTSFPRYHYLFQTALLPDNIQKYFADKKLFLETLKDELRTKILYRLYYEYGWGETESLKEAYPDIKFLIKGNLVNWMKKVKLVVIDHPHTSFLEALSINVPCVFYWDHEVYLMRPEAEEYFEHLRKVGILYKDPESAAEKVNEIYDDALGWWLSSKVQRVRNEFCSRYAYAHKDWLNIWANELKQLI